MWRFRCLIFLSYILLIVPTALASVNVEVGDDIYRLLSRLEAEGVIESGLLSSKPLSRKEVVRLIYEAERNAAGKSSYIVHVVESLKERFKDDFDDSDYIKPLNKSYIQYIYSDHGSQLNYNNDGDTFEDGSNSRLGFTSYAEVGRISFYLNPEFRYSEEDEDYMMRKIYGTLSLGGVDLQAGMDSQWWGPGYHGSILFSNNAQPLTMLRITNPEPALLPWLFKYLGPFKFVAFISELEDDRAVPEAILWGLRLNFKPLPYIEIGIQRTAFFGGEGRSEDFETWLKSFTGEGENARGTDEEAGDQRAGMDIKVSMPFDFQPIQIYGEAAGEDEAGGLPDKWAYLAGAYLPRILGLERLDFRAEYATTHVGDDYPDVWYNHHIYRSGYTYKGRIIGHHMGTDSDDLFFELGYQVPEINGDIRISYDKERHNLSGRERPSEDEIGVGVKIGLKDSLNLSGKYVMGKLRNSGREDEDISLFMLNLNYTF